MSDDILQDPENQLPARSRKRLWPIFALAAGCLLVGYGIGRGSFCWGTTCLSNSPDMASKGSHASKSSPSTPSEVPFADPSLREAIQRDNVSLNGAWIGDLQAGQALARKLNRPVFLDFAATWCLPCKILEKNVYKDPEIRKRLEKEFIPVKFDASDQKDPDVLATLKAYKVSGLPSALFVFPDGRIDEVNAFQGGFSKADLKDAMDEILAEHAQATADPS